MSIKEKIQEERLKYCEDVTLGRKEALEYFESIRDNIINCSNQGYGQIAEINSVRDMACLELLQIFINKAKDKLTRNEETKDGYESRIEPNIP